MTHSQAKKRKNSNTTLNQDLYYRIKIIASMKDVYINEVLEEAMRWVIKKYDHYLPDVYKLDPPPTTVKVTEEGE